MVSDTGVLVVMPVFRSPLLEILHWEPLEFNTSNANSNIKCKQLQRDKM
jgi:hypothetical protein